MKKSTGRAGSAAPRQRTWTEKGALVAAKVASAAAPIRTSSSTPESTITITTAASASSARRDQPRDPREPVRSSAVPGGEAAPINSTARIRPRGKLAIAEYTAARARDRREGEHQRRQQPPLICPVARARSRGTLTAVLGEPGLRRRDLVHGEALGLAGKQERQRAQRRAHPVLVADHGDALERRRRGARETGVGPHRVALDLARPAPEQVQQADLAPVRDLVAEDRFDGVLPIVVLDLADRLEADRPSRHVGPCAGNILLCRSFLNAWSFECRVTATRTICV